MGAYYKFSREVPHSVIHAQLGAEPAKKDLWKAFYNIMNAPEVRELYVQPSRLEKDKSVAEAHRKTGFDHFRNGKYEEALTSYNAAVRYSPESSSTLGMIYANRSAVLFMMDETGLSLNDIEKALDYKMPKKIRALLVTRKERCSALLQVPGGVSFARWVMSLFPASNRRPSALRSPLGDAGGGKKPEEPATDLTKDHYRDALLVENLRLFEAGKSGSGSTKVKRSRLLSDDIRQDATDQVCTMRRHAVIPAASEGLSMMYSPEKGRYYVANRDIDPGEFVLNETPYASVLYSEHWETHCQFCMRPADAPVPCSSCASVVFCSRSCREKATFHAVECPHMKDLADFAARDQGMLPLRMITRRDLGYFRDREFELKRLDERRDKAVQSMTGSVVDPDEYANVYTLLPHLESRYSSAIQKAATTAVFFTKCLAVGGFFGNLAKVEDTALIARLLFHNLLAFECNYFTLSQGGIAEDRTYAELPERGMAVFCGSSIFNHSCNPNVTHYFLEDRLYCRANGVIPKGKEVNISYGQYFYWSDRDVRRRALHSSYYFYPCSCQACLEKWPSMDDIPMISQYKCPSCGTALKTFDLAEVAANSCPACNTNLKPYVDVLDRVKKDAEETVAEVNSGNLRVLPDAIKALGNYQKALWTLATMPNVEYINVANILGEFFVMESLMKRRGLPVEQWS